MALIYDELTQSEEARVRLHISKCKKCKAEYSSLLETHELCKQAYALHFSASFWQVLDERLDRIDQEHSLKSAQGLPSAHIQVLQQKIGKRIIELLEISRLTPGFVREVLRPAGPALSIGISRGKARGVDVKDVPARKKLSFRVAPNTFVEVTVDKALGAPFRLLAKVVKEDKPLENVTVMLKSTKLSYRKKTAPSTGCAFFSAVERGRYEAVVSPPPRAQSDRRKWRFGLVLSTTRPRVSPQQAIAKRGKTQCRNQRN